MMASMRLLRMFLLVLLLPLLSLLPLATGSGGAVAAQAHHITTQELHASTPATAAHMPADCLGHATAAGQANPGANDAKTADTACDACSACQTCHVVGLAFYRADLQPLPPPHAQPQALSSVFASAPVARNPKPPIV